MNQPLLTQELFSQLQGAPLQQLARQLGTDTGQAGNAVIVTAASASTTTLNGATPPKPDDAGADPGESPDPKSDPGLFAPKPSFTFQAK